MYRTILDKLKAWKESEDRKPLILKGGAGTGKTWVLNEFGARFYKDVLYVDCRKAGYISYLVNGNLDYERIIARLSTYHGDEIIPGQTLLIFDEAHCVSGLVRMLLLLAREFPEYHICITGKNIENEIPQHEECMAIPCVLSLFPMNFKEFLYATNNGELVKKIELNGDVEDGADRLRIMTQIETYFLVGGFPKAVSEWIKTNELLRVREVHAEILRRLADEETEEFRNIDRSILNAAAECLKKDNKKFTYNVLTESSDIGAYKSAVCRLKEKGIVYDTRRVNEGKWPPDKFIDSESCKLYLCDIGILSYLYDFETKPFEEQEIFKIYNCALMEQFVFQELCSNRGITSLFYWTSQMPPAKADFLFDDDGMMIPVGIAKIGKRNNNGLTIFSKKYNVPVGIRVSFGGMSRNKGVLTIPMYAIWNL